MESGEEKVASKLVQAIQEQETKPEVVREFIEAALDNMYVATERELWNKNAVGAEITPDEKFFPYGTFINFIPALV